MASSTSLEAGNSVFVRPTCRLTSSAPTLVPGPGYDGDNHPLLSSLFNGSLYMLFDASGNPIFDDGNNGRVRKGTGGIVNTIVGGFLGDGGKATAAALVLPEALAIDKSNNIYIADYAGNRVRKVTRATAGLVPARC